VVRQILGQSLHGGWLTVSDVGCGTGKTGRLK
jgi:hypothetical protein